jgi:hypothetical protein
MSLAELMPALKALSRDEQVKLKLYLESELAKPEATHASGPYLDPESDLYKQFVAAASLYEGPVETTAEGIRALEQVLAEARAKRR